MLLEHQPQQLCLALHQGLVGIKDAAALVMPHVVHLLEPHKFGFVPVCCGTLAFDVLFCHLEVKDGSQALMPHEAPVNLREERRTCKYVVSPRTRSNHCRVLSLRTTGLVLRGGSHGDEVGLLHGAQRRLVPTEDGPEEDVVGHALVGARARQEPHRAPELRPRPLHPRLPDHQQRPHIGLRCLDQPAHSIARCLALVHVRYQSCNVTEAAADSRQL
mmetsp:Transcript_133321/g.371663  ORF Transcript_133321/g.371663 Transcript_133321/m.371663 type:complete len:217 (+) Transcript_133321:236-886(+)